MLVNRTPFKLNVIVISLLMSQHVLAEKLITQQEDNLEYTVITATRNPEQNLTLPNSVTIVDRQQIENLSPNATSLGEILAKTVPGMATSSQSMSNYSQTIRGRKVQVLVDGVPQSGSLRGSSRDLVNISPDMIERVEILRGPTGIYGQGAAGGVINIITRRASSEALAFTTKVSTHAQSADFSKSASADIFQQISGASEDTSYIASAKYTSTGLFYDAEDDAIPVSPHGQGGVSDSEDYNLYGKIDHYFDDNQSVELSAITTRLTQENNYHTVSGVYGEEKATLGDGPEENALGQENESWSVNSKYHHDDLMGSQLTLQAYAQASKARNKYNTKNKAQSITDSEKLGLRLTVDTEFESFVNGSIFWGADLAHEKAGQYMTDGRLWSPNLEQQTISPFANVRLQLTDSWILRFGARYDLFDLDIDTFQVNFGSNKGDTVTGGDLTYSATTFNTGLTYLVSDTSSVYISYSEGFSLPDVGRILRDGGASSVALLNPKPILVKNYEIGSKSQWQNLDANIAVFYNQSDLGLRFVGDANDTNFSPKREPEKVYGVELALNYNISNDWNTGGTFSWQEGKSDPKDNGDYDDYLTGERIPPTKITAFISNQTSENWYNQLDMLYSGNRDQFANNNAAADVDPNDTVKRQYAEGKVESFTIVDFVSRYKLPVGQVTFSVANLFNQDYYTAESQFRNRDAQYAKGIGRVFGLAYNLDW